MTFQHPYQRSSVASNASANAYANPLPTPSNHHSNGCSPTPHTPHALEAPTAAGAAGRIHTLKRKGQKGRRPPSLPVDNQQHRSAGLSADGSQGSQRESWSRLQGSTAPSSGQSDEASEDSPMALRWLRSPRCFPVRVAWSRRSHMPLCRNEIPRCHHLSADQRGVCTRDLSRP